MTCARRVSPRDRPRRPRLVSPPHASKLKGILESILSLGSVGARSPSSPSVASAPRPLSFSLSLSLSLGVLKSLGFERGSISSLRERFARPRWAPVLKIALSSRPFSFLELRSLSNSVTRRSQRVGFLLQSRALASLSKGTVGEMLRRRAGSLVNSLVMPAAASPRPYLLGSKAFAKLFRKSSFARRGGHSFPVRCCCEFPP